LIFLLALTIFICVSLLVSTMVRQVEVEKTRRSNMAWSSINSAPKKGGAGGGYTWGVADLTDCDLVGVDFNSLNVMTVTVSQNTPYEMNGASAPFVTDLDDEGAFPCLSCSNKKLEQDNQVVSPAAEIALSPQAVDDWIIVAPSPESELIENQQPRNRSARKPSNHERPLTIDWSEVGIPREVNKQIIKACNSASHQGLYAKEQASTLPLDILRAQNVDNSRRSNSAPRSRQQSVPRSHSKPRIMKQPVGRR
jgi:hypothetical protein